MQIGRAHVIVRHETHDRFAARERDELLPRGRERLSVGEHVRAALQIRHGARSDDELIRAHLVRARLARGLHRYQITRGDFDGDGRVGRRMIPLIESTHAHERRVAPVSLQFFLVGRDLKPHGGAAPEHDLLDGRTGDAFRADRRDAQAIGAGAQVDADEVISRRLALMIHAPLADVRVAHARTLDFN